MISIISKSSLGTLIIFFRDEDQEEIDRAPEERKAIEIHLDAIRECIFGGAVGDALGYPVEFFDEEIIF